MLKAPWTTAKHLAGVIAAVGAVIAAGQGASPVPSNDASPAQVGVHRAHQEAAAFAISPSFKTSTHQTSSPTAAAADSSLVAISFDVAKLSVASLRANLIKRYGPSVQPLDDLVQDDDDNGITALTASPFAPMVAFGIAGSPEQVQATIEPLSTGTSPATATTASATPDSGDDVVNAATRQWTWAADQGFFQAPHRPHILINDTVTTNANAEGLATAVGGVIKTGWTLFPHVSLIADIRVSPHTRGVALTDNNPSVDMEAIVLHEGWHAETFESPDLDKFNGALLHNDVQAQTFWKAAAWATNQVTYKEVMARVPQVVQRLQTVGPNLSNVFEEAGADTAAFTILAHAKDENDWKHRMLRMEGTRAGGGAYALALRDTHETQESLNILAHLGYDHLKALNPEQSRALIDAVAADGALLAAAKQGWAKNARTLADASDTLIALDPTSFSSATGTLLEKSFNQMKPQAQAWTHTPMADREQLADQATQKVQAMWENGGTLDYSYIAPGLTVTLAGNGSAPNYESDPVQPSSIPHMTPEQRNAASAHNLQALGEWKDMAKVLNYTSPSQVADLGDSDSFRNMVLWTVSSDRQTLAKDSFWAADVNTFLARLDASKTAASTASVQVPAPMVSSIERKSPKI